MSYKQFNAVAKLYESGRFAALLNMGWESAEPAPGVLIQLGYGGFPNDRGLMTNTNAYAPIKQSYISASTFASWFDAARADYIRIASDKRITD